MLGLGNSIPAPPPLIEIPEKLRTRRLRNTRQKDRFVADYMVAVTPQVADAFVRALMRGLHANNSQAIKLAGEMMGFLKQRDGLQIIANQQNNTTTNTVSVGEREEKISFDKICRTRDEERRKRMGLLPAPAIDTTAVEEPC